MAQEKVEFTSGLTCMFGEQQPHVLNWRADHHVIEVYDHQAFIRTIEQIATMAVAVDTYEVHIIEQACDSVENTRCDVLKSASLIASDIVVLNEMLYMFDCR